MATRAEIKAEQERLKASGFYAGAVDGVDGPSTRAAREASARDAAAAGAKKADADARAAEAQAKGAQAQADAAKAAVDRINAQARADRERAAAENAGVDRATQVAMNVGAAALGVGVGHLSANRMETRHQAFMKNNAAEVKAVGKEARSILARGVPSPKNNGQLLKLKGVVSTADKLHLGKIAGPKGAIAAGVLLTEAAISRFVIAPKLENETAREAVNSVATLGVFGATTILSERSIANATPQKLPSGKDLVAIETARAVVKESAMVQAEKVVKKAPSKAVAVASGVTRGGGKLALKALAPIGALLTAVSMFKSSAQAGESTPVAAAKALGAGADSVLTAGLLTAVVSDPDVQAGLEKQRTQPRGARGSAPMVTAPSVSPAERGTKALIGVGGLAFAKGWAAEARKPGVGLVARVGMRGAAVATGVVGAGLLVDAMSSGAKADDGTNAPRNDNSTRGFFPASVNAAMAVASAGIAVVSKGRTRNIATVAGVASGFNYFMKRSQEAAAVPPNQGKAYLNTAAQKKAETAAPVRAAPAKTAQAMPRSDGQTAGYTRVDPRTGQTVQVKGYATPRK